jgi:hypothetical protein
MSETYEVHKNLNSSRSVIIQGLRENHWASGGKQTLLMSTQAGDVISKPKAYNYSEVNTLCAN